MLIPVCAIYAIYDDDDTLNVTIKSIVVECKDMEINNIYILNI